MSTTINNAYIDAIAAQQIAANEHAAKLKKDAYKIGVEKSAQVMQTQADAAIEKARADANEAYNTNAVNQYVREEQLAESMANAGLTNSGLNATQKTAILTSRGNADSRARATEQAAIRNIELQLMGDKAQSEMDMLNYNTQVDASLAQENAQALSDASTRYTSAVKASAAERAKQISAATAAVKALNTGGLNETATINAIVKYADEYGLTETEIMTMCGNAGIAYDKFKSNSSGNKVTTISKVVANPYQTSNYEAALKAYNVSETGRKVLLPELVEQGILSEHDMNVVETVVWPKLKTIIDKSKSDDTDKINSVPGAVAELCRVVYEMNEHKQISEQAETYMIALINYHSFGEYVTESY